MTSLVQSIGGKANRTVLMGSVGAFAILASGFGPAAAQSSGFEEIIVTAQKREERLQDIPATITALSADQLDARGLNSTVDLQHATPGVTFGQSSSFSLNYIRGVGNAFSTVSAQSPVAFYVDGVYIADVSSTFFGLTDVDHIEILKGPQGTLYGRNVVGGAVNILTMKPHEGYESKLEVTLGNYNARKIAGYVNGGSDLVQANVSISRHERDGYYENLNPGFGDLMNVDELMVRGKLQFTPGNGAEFLLAGDYLKSQFLGGAGGNLQFYPETAGVGTQVLPYGVLLGGQTTAEPWKTYIADDNFNDTDHWGVSLTGRFDLNSMELVSISAYRDFTIRHPISLDGTNTGLNYIRTRNFHRNFSQEFQLLSNTEGRFSWIAGLYYLWDDAGFNPLHVNQFPVQIDIYSAIETNSYAAFGEGTFNLTDNLAVVAGLRYTRDELEHYRAQQNVFAPAPPTFALTQVVALNSGGSSKSFDALTPRLTLKYSRPEGQYYATYSKGYKSGLYDPTDIKPAASLDEPINPEKVTAYEIGAKWSFFGDTLQINAAGFYYEDKDLQIENLQSSGATTFENGDGEIKGFDLDGAWLVTPSFTLWGGFEILNAEYSHYPDATGYVPHSTLFPVTVNGVTFPGTQQGVAPCPGGAASTTNASACSSQIDLTGERMLRSPELTAVVGADWDLPVPETFGGLTLSASLYHSDEFLTSVNGTMKSPAYELVNASITYNHPSEKWSLRFFGNNVTDAEYYLTGGETESARQITYAPPAMYGVTLTMRGGGN